LLAAGPGPPWRFAVIGDSGTGDAYQYRIAEQMLTWHDRLPFSLVLMLGDNIYGGFLGTGGGSRKDFEEKFDRPYAGLLARGVIFRATLGNHDMRHDDGRDLIADFGRFHIGGPLGYYSFTAGEWLNEAGEAAPLVEFFVLNTVRLEKDKKDPEQLAWLERALASSRARWRIVYGHHPLYSTGARHGSNVAVRQRVEPVLLSPGGEPRVLVVFAGHDHIYQRWHPQRGIAYFVCGSSGKLRRGNARPSAQVAKVEDQLRSFMLWEATLEELRFRAINEHGEAFDCGRIHPSGAVKAVACTALVAGAGTGLTPSPN
jgi:3',5'-cyclic AMP phosphodiesterase CpdA